MCMTALKNAKHVHVIFFLSWCAISRDATCCKKSKISSKRHHETKQKHLHSSAKRVPNALPFSSTSHVHDSLSDTYHQFHCKSFLDSIALELEPPDVYGVATARRFLRRGGRGSGLTSSKFILDFRGKRYSMREQVWAIRLCEGQAIVNHTTPNINWSSRLAPVDVTTIITHAILVISPRVRQTGHLVAPRMSRRPCRRRIVACP